MTVESSREETPRFRAGTRWVPSASQLRRGRALMLKELRKRHNLTLVQFAARAGKSRQQICRDLRVRRLLALSVGSYGLRIPDWQLDTVKARLARSLMARAPNVDMWTLYQVLTEPAEALSEKTPIRAISPTNGKDVIDLLLSRLGFHVCIRLWRRAWLRKSPVDMMPIILLKTAMRRADKRRSTIRTRATDMARCCAGQYNFSPEDCELPDHLLDQVRKTAIQAENVVDDALAYVAESERRLANLGGSNRQRMEICSPRRQRRRA